MLENKLKSLVVKNDNGSPSFDLLNIGLKSGIKRNSNFNTIKFLRDISNMDFSLSDYSVIRSGICIDNFLFPVYAALREDECLEIGPMPGLYKSYAKQHGLDTENLPLFYLGSFHRCVESLFDEAEKLSVNGNFINHFSKVYDLKDF